jgi:hypothetical protein
MKPQTASANFSTLIVETLPQLCDHGAARFRAFSGATFYDTHRALMPTEIDGLDTAPKTRLLNTYCDDQCVGAARIVQPCEVFALHHGLEIGLPLARKYDLRPLMAEGSLAEPSRLCVVPAFRGTPAARVTMDGVFRESRRLAVDFLVGAANTETDSLEDARIQLRVLEARGLVSREHRLPRKDRTEAPGRADRPFYTSEQRERAVRGDLEDLPFARTLALYARAGARFLGEPALDGVFGLYALPLIVRVAETPDLLATPAPPSRRAA